MDSYDRTARRKPLLKLVNIEQRRNIKLFRWLGDFWAFSGKITFTQFLTIDESRDCLAKYLTAPPAAHYNMEINLEYKLLKASGMCGECQC